MTSPPAISDATREAAYDAIETRMGYRFRDRSLLQLALTHGSAGAPSNERLEFLGDAVLGLVVAERLYTRLAGEREGTLTELRARAVGRPTLARLFDRLSLGAFVRLGECVAEPLPDSIRANVVEAIIGAVYLDGGLAAAERLIDRELDAALDTGESADRNWKSILQEIIQGDSGETPRYDCVGSEGPPHAPRFVTAVFHRERELGRGDGASKKAAEQRAAESAVRTHFAAELVLRQAQDEREGAPLTASLANPPIEPVPEPVPSPSTNGPTAECVVFARGLRKSYRDLVAVAGIDFEVQRGECFGFLGPNGAGKTTTMRMIYRATPVDGGELRVLSHDAASGLDDRAIKRRIGVIPQEDNLDQDLTVRENLRVFCRFHGIAGDAAEARCDELLAFVRLTAKAHAPVRALSGGMKRRALVARGLVSEPDLVILDEPTTGLDPQARQDLWERLHALKQRRATLLLTTHYMDEAEKLCDRLVILDRGKIVAKGTPQALIARHVPPHVVEVRLDGGADALRGREASLRASAVRSELLTDRLLLYTADGERLITRVARDLPELPALLRRATLEDVFLAITGRALDG